jgi:hypothetical protein
MFDEVSVSVLIANHTSTAFHPATGVLQGSVLSPHLYSLYINSLPDLLRSVASSGDATLVTPSGASGPLALNCLLFADDVAIFGSQAHVQAMLDLAAQHSFSVGYHWNPSKCAVLNPPDISSGFRFTLSSEPLPTVDEFVYLGMPFRKRGLHDPGFLSLRSGGAVKTMALLNLIGVNRNGFSLLLSARLYTAFIRPKIEYGLAMSRLSATDFTALDALQSRLVGMFIDSSWTSVAKHMTCLPNMKHRYNTLVTRYTIRSQTLPDDCLLVLLRDHLHYPRLVKLLYENPLYKSLPDSNLSSTALRTHIQDYWQDLFDKQMSTSAFNGSNVLLRACRSSTTRPDPILYLPISRIARSRLARWRLGRFTNMREECP